MTALIGIIISALFNIGLFIIDKIKNNSNTYFINFMMGCLTIPLIVCLLKII